MKACLNRSQIIFIVMFSPKDLSIKSNGQNTIRDKSKIIALVYGTQHMKRSTSRYTQSLCLPDTRWRKTLLQTKSDIIPPIQFVRKTHWWIYFVVQCVPSARRSPLSQSIVLYSIYISIHNILSKTIKAVLLFFFTLR